MPLFEAERFALKSALSLCVDKQHYASVKRRPILNELALTAVKEPVNREENLYDRFLSILQKNRICVTAPVRNPYWMSNTLYNLAEVFGTCIQFMDQYEGDLPKTTLPPAEHIERFINIILSQTNQITVDQQFEILLNITGNSIIGAANVGMLATRYMSRFGEYKAYPNLLIAGQVVTADTSDEQICEIMREWNKRIARFESFDNSLKNDGPGDSYYFWTHFFAASVLNTDDIKARLIQQVFEHGTDIMIFVKNNIAKRNGVVSSHREASLLGRNIGLALTSV